MKRIYTVFTLLFTLVACAQKKEKQYNSPVGYDFNRPQIIELPDKLQEISGISFYKGNAQTVFAEQDEEGKIFYFQPDANPLTVKESRFGKKGDYEDITVLDDLFLILRSDGTLYSFPFAPDPEPAVKGVNEWAGLLPKGEYEAMAADEQQLYVLCKQCNIDKKGDQTSGYVFNFASGSLKQTASFTIDGRQIDKLIPLKGKSFRPSALAKNPFTKEWFILSSVNSLLVVADEQWQVKAAYRLNSKLFNQPEGLAFDKNRNLYISNEAGGKNGEGTIIVFQFSN